MITSFDIIQRNNKLNLDDETVSRLLKYNLYKDLYDGNFKKAFAKTYAKICAKYPLDTTTSQTFVELNLFYAMTDFYKNLLTNQGLFLNVNEPLQQYWNEIEKNNNFISVLKEVFIDVSRYGDGLFKVIFGNDGVEINSVSPAVWIPVFEKGNINHLSGHILINSLSEFINGKKYYFKFIEKHHKGFVENELWLFKNGNYTEKLNIEKELNVPQVDDFSDIWNDFLIFPVKNTSESDEYFGQSDYKNIKSVIEELMLTVSQNSKIINRHANPKMTGSNENLEYNPMTGKTEFPNKDFIPVGRDGIKAEYITADLQENAVNLHMEKLMQFFYILTKTPAQAYGIDLTNNLSGESLRKLFMTSLTKIDDIKQVSFNPTLQKVVKCAMALNCTPVDDVKTDWGNPLPEDRSVIIDNYVKRVSNGLISKETALAELDNISPQDAELELKKISAEQDFIKQFDIKNE